MTSKQTADRREVRWILEGRVPRALRPSGQPRRRRDQYELDTLTCWRAAKRRGTSATLELKVRTGRVEHVEWSGVNGFIETWRKAPAADHRGGGRWITVDKELWSFGFFEVCHFSTRDISGWTVCVDVDQTRTSKDLRLQRSKEMRVLERWLPELGRQGSPDSYPSWLARQCFA